MTVIHPPERSLPARQETIEIREMRNNGANPNNQSPARESAKHTIENHTIGASALYSGRHTGAHGRSMLENCSCQGARKPTKTRKWRHMHY